MVAQPQDTRARSSGHAGPPALTDLFERLASWHRLRRQERRQPAIEKPGDQEREPGDLMTAVGGSGPTTRHCDPRRSYCASIDARRASLNRNEPTAGRSRCVDSGLADGDERKLTWGVRSLTTWSGWPHRTGSRRAKPSRRRRRSSARLRSLAWVNSLLSKPSPSDAFSP